MSVPKPHVAYIIEAVRTPGGKNQGLLSKVRFGLALVCVVGSCSCYAVPGCGTATTAMARARPRSLFAASLLFSPLHSFSSLLPPSKIHPVDLGATVLRELITRTNIDASLVDDVIFGCVSQVGGQGGNLGRNCVLAAGFPESVPVKQRRGKEKKNKREERSRYRICLAPFCLFQFELTRFSSFPPGNDVRSAVRLFASGASLCGASSDERSARRGHCGRRGSNVSDSNWIVHH